MRMVSWVLRYEAWTMKRGGFNEFQTPFQKECWCTHLKNGKGMFMHISKWDLVSVEMIYQWIAWRGGIFKPR